MPTKEQHPVTILEGDTHSSEGVLYLSSFSRNDRLKRAFSSMLLCWLAAGLSVFIPIAHFFLVPVLLISGPVLFYIKVNQQQAKEKIEGVCPSTQSPLLIELEANAKMPMWTYCTVCNKSIKIELTK